MSPTSWQTDWYPVVLKNCNDTNHTRFNRNEVRLYAFEYGDGHSRNGRRPKVLTIRPYIHSYDFVSFCILHDSSTLPKLLKLFIYIFLWIHKYKKNMKWNDVFFMFNITYYYKNRKRKIKKREWMNNILLSVYMYVCVDGLKERIITICKDIFLSFVYPYWCGGFS